MDFMYSKIQQDVDLNYTVYIWISYNVENIN